MTREEAIFCEKSYLGETNCTDCKYYGTDTCESRESHKMAIRALEQEPILGKIREQIMSNLKGVDIALEVLGENHPLRQKMEGAKDTLVDCLELIDKAETEG